VAQEGHGAVSADGVVAVSKGVIQRGHQHTATITGENLFQPPNPFNRMSDDDVDNYKADLENQSDSGRFTGLVPCHTQWNVGLELLLSIH